MSEDIVCDTLAHLIFNHVRGPPFDSEGGGGGGAGTFWKKNILTLKMMEIDNLSSSGKKINKLT